MSHTDDGVCMDSIISCSEGKGKRLCLLDLYRKAFFQVCEQSFRNRGKYLIFFPDQIDVGLQPRGERAERKSAAGTGIDEVPKGQEVSKTLFDEH